MPQSLMRPRDGGHEAGRVTYVELFFDLVFVFAITQLSHTLLEHMTPRGWLETAVLMVGLWWMWIDTSWVTNWLNPERWPVRVLLLVLMLGGLVLSTSVPHAFDTRALVFGLAYGATHLLRTGVMLVTLRREGRPEAGTFGRMLVWHGLLAAAWAAGAVGSPESWLPIWGAAILVETALPAFGYWVPGLGRAHASDWASVEGGHMAERCALFIIIALGESILVTGATVAALPWTPSTIAAFVVSFVGSVAMWWIYFGRHADIGMQRIAHSHDPGAIARSAYTYLHIPIVAGSSSPPWATSGCCTTRTATPVSPRRRRCWAAPASICWARPCSNTASPGASRRRGSAASSPWRPLAHRGPSVARAAQRGCGPGADRRGHLGRLGDAPRHARGEAGG